MGPADQAKLAEFESFVWARSWEGKTGFSHTTFMGAQDKLLRGAPRFRSGKFRFEDNDADQEKLAELVEWHRRKGLYTFFAERPSETGK